MIPWGRVGAVVTGMIVVATCAGVLGTSTWRGFLLGLILGGIGGRWIAQGYIDRRRSKPSG